MPVLMPMAWRCSLRATPPGERLPSAVVRCATGRGCRGPEGVVLHSGKRVQSGGSGQGYITITIMERAQFLRSASVQVMIGIYLLQNAID